MKHIKRLICIGLILALLCGILPATALAATPNTPFRDVANNTWYTAGVEFSYLHGLMNGTSSNTFSPNGALNRAMLVTILYRAEGSPAISGTNPFSDVPAGKFYTQAVQWAAQNEIVNGIGHGKFAPNGNVTREALAAIFYRYSNYKNYNTSAFDDLSGFSDADKISGWAVSAMQWAVGAGLLKGANGTMAPGDNTTRSQVATILQRYFSTVAAGSNFTSNYTKAMNAYATFLTQKSAQRASGVRFGTAFVDGDCIPELITCPGGSHLAQVTVYTFHNGKIVDLGQYGEYGTLPYNPWGNCFGFYSKPYKIQNGKAVQTSGTIRSSVDYGDMFDITSANISRILYPYLLN